MSTSTAVLEFLCDRRFHKSFVLAPNPGSGRSTPYRVSFADYGDQDSNAVVLFCGALMGTRLSYAPLDQLAKACNVRIIHPDRPGIGGSDAVDFGKRIETWLEVVPQLLAHLQVPYVSLASHSGGDVYLLNTVLTYPHLLHPVSPYVSFFAPWVHPSHTRIAHMQVTELLPAPMIGKFAFLAKLINDNVTPLVGLSGSFAQGLKDSYTHSTPSPAPVLLASNATGSRAPSMCSRDDPHTLLLDDPDVVKELRKYITKFLFAESMDGISADAQLFMRKPRSVPWCSSTILWSDIDKAVPLLSEIIEQDGQLKSDTRKWIIHTFHAEKDDMVGERGRQWFDDCWAPSETPASTSSSSNSPSHPDQQIHKTYEYKSKVVQDTEHNFIMDPAFGASEVWLKQVREAFPPLVEV